jgi:hypothetical protein
MLHMALTSGDWSQGGRMPVSRTIVLVSERVKVHASAARRTRSCEVCSHAATQASPSRPRHPTTSFSPAIAVVGIVLNLDDSAWRAPELLIGAHDF